MQFAPGYAPTQADLTRSYGPQGTGMNGVAPKPNPTMNLPQQITPQQPFPGVQSGGMPSYLQGMPQQSFPGLQPGGLPSYLQGGGPPSQQYPQQSALLQQYMQQPAMSPEQQQQQQQQYVQRLMQQYPQQQQQYQGQEPPQQPATANPAIQPPQGQQPSQQQQDQYATQMQAASAAILPQYGGNQDNPAYQAAMQAQGQQMRGQMGIPQAPPQQPRQPFPIQGPGAPQQVRPEDRRMQAMRALQQRGLSGRQIGGVANLMGRGML